jgi:hypothetical protein
MQTNAELQAELTALRTQLADGSARISKMKAELVNGNARPPIWRSVCELPAEVVAVQAQATDTAADESITYINYAARRPDGTRSYYGAYKNGFGFKSDGYPDRMNPRKHS